MTNLEEHLTDENRVSQQQGEDDQKRVNSEVCVSVSGGKNGIDRDSRVRHFVLKGLKKAGTAYVELSRMIAKRLNSPD